MVTGNHSIEYVMQLQDESQESILNSMCKLGQTKALRFMRSIVARDLFVQRLTTPQRHNCLALEAAVERQHIMTVKFVLTTPEIVEYYTTHDDVLFRLVYVSIKNFESTMWDVISRSLHVNAAKLLEFLKYQMSEPSEEEQASFAENFMTFHDKSLFQACVECKNRAVDAVFSALMGQEMFEEKMAQFKQQDAESGGNSNSNSDNNKMVTGIVGVGKKWQNYKKNKSERKVLQVESKSGKISRKTFRKSQANLLDK
jgi:hypothetical protein